MHETMNLIYDKYINFNIQENIFLHMKFQLVALKYFLFRFKKLSQIQ